MKILYISLLFLMNCVLSVAQPEIIIPKPHQLKWHEAEMGAVFHYDLHVFDGIRYGQGNNRISPIEDYNIFNPTQLNTDQWVSAAKAAGCKFAVLTATHETGFGLWQSDVNPYCLKRSWKKNGCYWMNVLEQNMNDCWLTTSSLPAQRCRLQLLRPLMRR